METTEEENIRNAVNKARQEARKEVLKEVMKIIDKEPQTADVDIYKEELKQKLEELK